MINAINVYPPAVGESSAPVYTAQIVPGVSSKHSTSEDRNQKIIRRVAEEMNRRATDFAYGLGAGFRNILNTKTSSSDTDSDQDINEILKAKAQTQNKKPEPFSDYFSKIFPHEAIKVLYIGLDPGVDDTAALIHLLSVRGKTLDTNESKKVEIEGLIPSVGNVVLGQSIKNTMQVLELTVDTDVKVYRGAVAPLAIENNQTAISEMVEGINSIHFYGYDGEEDVGGWPQVTLAPQQLEGYKFSALSIAEAKDEKSMTLVSTSSLTEMAKTFTELARLEVQNNVKSGTYFGKIAALSIMGGCINPKVGCNAPFGVPNDKKDSEANFFFDPHAAQAVFSYAQRFNIPLLLAPLDLTQEPGLLWTSSEVTFLRSLDNAVSNQFARVSQVVPYKDKSQFPLGTYPMHDLQAVANLVYPGLYNVTRVAAKIGSEGQVIIDPTSPEQARNIFILGMSRDNQTTFYRKVLADFQRFSCSSEQTKYCSHGQGLSVGSILGITAGAIGCVGASVLGALGLRKYFSKNQSNDTLETAKLLN